MALGIYYLIRVRVPQFELHRWMDGIAVTLVVLAAGFAPGDPAGGRHKTVGDLATFVAFLYPVLDVLLIGAVLGVYGLLGWRPDTMWILIGLAVVSSAGRRRRLRRPGGREDAGRRVRRYLRLHLDTGCGPPRVGGLGPGA